MKRKSIITAIVTLLVALTVYLSVPQNHYIVKALIHQKPKIYHNTIFANREIAIGTPEPWQSHPLFNTYELLQEQQDGLGKYGTVAFLITRDSLLLFEKYWDGYGPQSHSNSFSMAKSIVSLLLGCAIDDGFIESLDQPVGDFLDEFKDGEKSKITIRHLLTMSSGLSWDEAYSSLFSTTTRAYYGKYLSKQVLNQTVVSEPGKEYNYLSGDTQLLSMIIAKAVGKNLSQYMSEKIWSQIGAEEVALWSLDREGGIEKAYCCFNSNARDFARIGRLILNDGAWNGNQLISQSYLSEILHPTSYLADKQLGGISTERYGHQWWFTTHRDYPVIFARGILGQYIFVIPDLNVVAVRLGHERDKESIGGQPIDIFVYLDIVMDIEQSTR